MDEETRWLTDDAAEAWLQLVAVLQLLPAALDAQLSRASGLSFVEFLALAQLADAPEKTMRLTDLAAATNASLPRISRVVDRLERGGAVERQPDAHDGRSRRVSLTILGQQRLSSSAVGHIAFVNRVFVDQLTTQQLHQLREIGRRLVEGLDPKGRVLTETFSGRNGRPGLSRAPDVSGD